LRAASVLRASLPDLAWLQGLAWPQFGALYPVLEPVQAALSSRYPASTTSVRSLPAQTYRPEAQLAALAAPLVQTTRAAGSARPLTTTVRLSRQRQVRLLPPIDGLQAYGFPSKQTQHAWRSRTKHRDAI
jgi:hypothetical protein